MKKPVVNLLEFRFSKLNTPQFSHLKYLVGWIFYFSAYFITEALIPAEKCHVIHSPLDDLIPFCEYFFIFYVGWYVLVVASLLYFAMYNPETFKRLQVYIMVTQLLAMIIYVVYPSRQDLRPEVFVNDNIFTQFAELLYRFDTNTNVCPSLHCAYSIGLISIWTKEKEVPVWVRILIVIFSVMVCASTAFVKQHSVIDFFAALPVCLVAELFTYRKRYFKRKTA